MLCIYRLLGRQTCSGLVVLSLGDDRVAERFASSGNSVDITFPDVLSQVKVPVSITRPA